MKLSVIMNIAPAMRVLSNIKLPATAAYRVSKVIKKIDPELKLFEESRIAIAAELGTLSEDKSNYSFSDENMAKYKTQVNELLEEEVEISLPKLAIADLGNITIEPSHLAALDGIILFETLDLSPVQ